MRGVAGVEAMSGGYTRTYRKDGKTFKGAQAVADEYGVALRTVYHHMTKYGNLDKITPERSLPNPAIQIEVGGVTFEHGRDMAAKIGVPTSAIVRWRHSTARIEAAVAAYKASIDGTKPKA